MKKKVLSLAAMVLFMVSNLDAKEVNMESNFECDSFAQDVFDTLNDRGYDRGASYELSEIAYMECEYGKCEDF